MKTLCSADGPLLAYSPDGETMAVSHDRNARVQLVDAHTGTMKWTVSTFEPPTKPYEFLIFLTSLAFSPDGKTLSTVTNGVARFWDVETGRKLNFKLKTDYHVGTIAFSPDGKTFVVGEGGLSPVRRPMTAGVQYQPLPISKSHKLLASYQEPSKSEAIKKYKSSLELYDARTRTFIRKIAEAEGEISSLQFLPNGKSLAYINSVQWDDTKKPLLSYFNLELRNVKSGKLLAQESNCGMLAVMPRSNKVVGFGDGEWVKVFNVSTGHLDYLLAQCGNTGTAAVSPDEQTLATGGSLNHAGTPIHLRLWNMRAGILKVSLREPVGYDSYFFWAAASKDDTRLVAENAEGRIDTWSLQTGALHNVQNSGAFIVRCLFSSDCQTVLEEIRAPYLPYVPEGKRKTLRLRNCQTGRVIRQFYNKEEDLRALAWSDDDTLIATSQEVVTHDNRNIRNPDIWIRDARTTRKLFRLTPPMPGINKIFFSHNGRRLISQSNKRDILPPDEGDIEVDVWDMKDRRLLCTYPLKANENLMGLTAEDHLVIAQDGGDKRDALIPLREAATGKLAGEWRTPEHVTVETDNFALSKDGKVITISDHWSGTNAILDSVTGKTLGAFSKDGGESLVFILRNGLAVSYNPYDFRISDTKSGKLLATLCPLPPVGKWIAYTPVNNFDGSPDVQRYVNWRSNDLLYFSEELTKQHYKPGLLHSLLAEYHKTKTAKQN